jgi:hypothetical protein
MSWSINSLLVEKTVNTDVEKANDMSKKIKPAKVHFKRLSEKADPFQHSPQTINPIVIIRGASIAVKIPVLKVISNYEP